MTQGLVWLVVLVIACGKPDSATPESQSVVPVEAGSYTGSAKLGDSEVTAHFSDGEVRVTVTDGSGQLISPDLDGLLVLKGSGQIPQRVNLHAQGTGWRGSADIESAPGYVAVFNVNVNGRQETARLTWGEAHQIPIAPPPMATPSEPRRGGGQ